MNKYKSHKRFKLGFTLVELVVTLALIAIVTGMTSTFLYMFIKINNNIDTYRKTYQNANSISYILSTFVDQKNDGGLSVGSENNLLNYTDEENTYTLYYNSETDELIYNDKSLYASEDKSLEISITYLEKFEDKQLIKFEISYDNNKRSMSLIKTLY